MAASRKEHLLNTALRLFNQYGFHATGIDKVQAESGVSKTTMYKYFKTKDDLIKAVLEKRHEQFGEWFSGRVQSISNTLYSEHPYGQLIAMFDAVDEWIHSDSFFGCNFINASAEFSDLQHPIHLYASQHKLELSNYIRSCLPNMALEDTDEIAKDILLLLDGAIVCAHTTGLKDSAKRGKDMMLRLLANYSKKTIQ